MDIQEIIKLLERIAEFLYQETEGNCPYCGAKDYPVCKNKKGYDEVKPEDAEEWRIDHSETCIVVSIDQTLTLLKQQSKVGDFTEKFNRIIEEAKSMFVVSQAMAKNSFDSTLQIPVEGETDNPDPLPDHEYPQQPEPTSLGNTIRRIANNSKCNETDRNIIHQAADRLDAWWKYIGELKVQVKAKDELLFAYESVRAPKQPTAGDFTKDFREQIGRQAVGIGSLGEIRRMAKEACDRLDRAEARLKELEVENGKLLDTLMAAGFIGQGTQIIGDKRYEELMVAEAINKDLLEACEKLLKMCDRLDVHDVDCATQAAGVADEFAAMGCTCEMRKFRTTITKAKKKK